MFGNDYTNSSAGEFGVSHHAHDSEDEEQRTLAEHETEGKAVPVATATWLRKRGKVVRPELTKQQRAQMLECFNLIDADGSGSIGAQEMSEAFRFMGINLSNKEFLAIMSEVDRDGSGAVEYDEFVEIMTSSLERHTAHTSEMEPGDHQHSSHTQTNNYSGSAPLPFPLLATAYRRKKLLSAMLSGDAQKRAEMAEQANRAMAEVAKLNMEEDTNLKKTNKKKEVKKDTLRLPRMDLKMLGINPDEPPPQSDSEKRLPALAAKAYHRRQYGLSIQRPGRTNEFQDSLPLPNIRTYNFASGSSKPRITSGRR